MESMLLPILMFAALGAMMYFGMRKQKRQVAEVQKMQTQLVPGTRVMTTSGLYAEITAVADDTIELELAPGFRTTWVKAAVREIVVPSTTDDAELAALTQPADETSAGISLDKRRGEIS